MALPSLVVKSTVAAAVMAPIRTTVMVAVGVPSRTVKASVENDTRGALSTIVSCAPGVLPRIAPPVGLARVSTAVRFPVAAPSLRMGTMNVCVDTAVPKVSVPVVGR